jgi:hypothetical protein
VATAALPRTDCRKLTRLARKMSHTFYGHTPAGDTKTYADFLQQLAKRTPSGIRDDFGVLANTYTRIADALAQVYTDPAVRPTAAQRATLADVGKELDTSAVHRAAGNLNAWLQQSCGR